jgi:small GTP-binding protein
MATRSKDAVDSVLNIKLVLLGLSSVGKTTIIMVAKSGQFIPDQAATIGACFHTKRLDLGGITINLHIWDTAGQDELRALAPLYYRDAQFALLVYAINNQNSFDEVIRWHTELVNRCPSLPSLVIIGNKTDLSQREVTLQQGMALAEKLNAQFFEVSAKADPAGIKQMLEEIGLEAIKCFGETDMNVRMELIRRERDGRLTCCRH